uniref:ATP synthase F0 subunit 8 n=1 Tax=Psyllopsis discrepans TaxID=2283586 RepID=UPI002A7F5EEE|nr:ATP synthase F0 subunit 8 [Psyllopsis discrepans]WON66130.1 ATP synthase subunit 8 [Psyllopsis discrepans]
MPQMSPIPWLMIFFLSLISLMMVVVMIYFNSNKNPLIYTKSTQQVINMKW